MDTETAGIGVLIGSVLPLLISVINRVDWTDRVKAIVAFVVCMLAAAVSSLLVEGVDVRDPNFDFVAYAATLYGSAMIAYGRFWRPTRVAPAIEAAT